MKRLGTVGKVRLVALSNAQAAHKAGLFTVRKAGSRPENSNGRRCGAATIPFVRIADTDAAEEEPDSPTGFAFPERHLRSGTVLPELVLAAWVSGEWAKRRAMAAVLPPANKGA